MSAIKRLESELVERLITIGQEIEAEDYNTRFGIKRNRSMVYRRRQEAKKIIDQIGWDRIEQLQETNDDLEYSLQFI